MRALLLCLLQDFVDECVLAYECGYTEGDLAAQAGAVSGARVGSGLGQEQWAGLGQG